MALPLFDDVLVDAVPPEPRPGYSRAEFERDRHGETGERLAEAHAFELDDPRPKSHRPALVARHGTPYYFAFWTAVRARGRRAVATRR